MKALFPFREPVLPDWVLGYKPSRRLRIAVLCPYEEPVQKMVARALARDWIETPYLIGTTEQLGMARVALLDACQKAGVEHHQEKFHWYPIAEPEPLAVPSAPPPDSTPDSAHRPHKLVSYRLPDETTQKIVAEAVTLAQLGRIDIAVKGKLGSDQFLRGFLKTQAGLVARDFAAHLFCLSGAGLTKPLFLMDGALNIAPTVDQRVAMIAQSLPILRRFGRKKPIVAVLSCTEKPNESVPSSVEAVAIVEQARDLLGSQLDIFGPVALDIALSERAAHLKSYQSSLAGDTDLLVVPSIEVGNALFKLFNWMGGGVSAGLVTGLKIPLVLTSRSDSSTALLASLALAGLTAGRPEGPAEGVSA